MRVVVNNEETVCEAGTSVLMLIRRLGLNPERVVVELNTAILPAAAFADTVLAEGDRLELLQFVGGVAVRTPPDAGRRSCGRRGMSRRNLIHRPQGIYEMSCRDTHMDDSDVLYIGATALHSRLFVGTGKYGSDSLIPGVIAASGAEVITVALRRVDLAHPEDNVLAHIPEGVRLLPNTSGARTADGLCASPGWRAPPVAETGSRLK